MKANEFPNYISWKKLDEVDRAMFYLLSVVILGVTIPVALAFLNFAAITLASVLVTIFLTILNKFHFNVFLPKWKKGIFMYGINEAGPFYSSTRKAWLLWQTFVKMYNLKLTGGKSALRDSAISAIKEFGNALYDHVNANGNFDEFDRSQFATLTTLLEKIITKFKEEKKTSLHSAIRALEEDYKVYEETENIFKGFNPTDYNFSNGELVETLITKKEKN